ncbi:MAG: hypothetical protein Q9195_004605 [Heterodermia aff. obscurata]
MSGLTNSDLAAKYDIPLWIQEMSARITAYLQQQLDFIGLREGATGGRVSLLDYACGTGLVSRALGPYVDSIQALDLSANMVARYKDLAASSPLVSVKDATARVGNILTDELANEELHGFSIAAICAALHHVESPALAIRRLAGRLRSEGALLVIDFVEDGVQTQHDSPAEHTIHKHAFSKDEMKEMMEDAGLVDFEWKEMPGKVALRMDENHPVFRTMFLARAVCKGL